MVFLHVSWVLQGTVPGTRRRKAGKARKTRRRRRFFYCK
jgi:hypothetical protein